MENKPDIEAQNPLVRIADALESIAESLEKVANPPVVLWGSVMPEKFIYPGSNISFTSGKPPEMIGTNARED